MNSSSIQQLDDAGIGARVLSYLIDVAAIVMVPYILVNILVRLVMAPFLGHSTLWPVVVGVFFVYQIYFVWKGGQTIGGRLLGVRVATVDGKNPSFIRALVRGVFVGILPFCSGVSWVLRYLGLAIAFMIALVRDKRTGMRRTAWDHLVGTCVVKVSKQ